MNNKNDRFTLIITSSPCGTEKAMLFVELENVEQSQ